MSWYAIGTPGQLARALMQGTAADAARQLLAGEAAVPVDDATPRVISTDGSAAVAPIAVALPAITTAVQLSTTIPVPAGARWLAKGAAFTGPQDISFAAPGDYVVKMDGRWMGAGTVTVLSAADYRAWLVDQVKAEGERRSMLVMSIGGSKKTKYAAKSAEIENWYALGGLGAITSTLLAAFSALNTTVRKRKFRFAIQDAAKHGDTVPAAIARFVSGADASLDEIARLEGIEQAGVDTIRAAGSSAAALAAYRAVNWTAA
ncbi:hypothetical protein [Sphingomonas solaris]|uniref:hypothetical protein n=1 Tax=Alterirhizorhabdus solaris TaxID=2529389 RepID=UPI001396C723|nr:hypothetical protein [Sphingomonas solaris]